MTDLDALIEAVDAGDVSGSRSWSVVRMLGKTSADRSDFRNYADMAFRGSLDAALRLHGALLPGWHVLQLHQFEAGHWLAQVYHPQDENWPKWTPYPKAEAVNDIAARAWLLAILRALKAKGDQNGTV